MPLLLQNFAIELMSVCFTGAGFSFVWDNTQLEVKAHHQSRNHQNKFKLWALMFAVRNRVAAPVVGAQAKLW